MIEANMALLEFYGNTCPHCKEMDPVVEKLQKELDVEIEKFEVWENEENAEKMKEYDKGLCGGVPFFYNTDNGQYLCGATDYETLKSWAQGKLSS